MRGRKNAKGEEEAVEGMLMVLSLAIVEVLGMAAAMLAGGSAEAYSVSRERVPRKLVSRLFHSRALNQISCAILGEAMVGSVLFARRWVLR